jgi:hypothetical protein
LLLFDVLGHQRRPSLLHWCAIGFSQLILTMGPSLVHCNFNCHRGARIHFQSSGAYFGRAGIFKLACCCFLTFLATDVASVYCIGAPLVSINQPSPWDPPHGAPQLELPSWCTYLVFPKLN